MFEIDNEKFSLFIHSLRKEKGMTQQQLADKLFVSNKAVSKWERGINLPDVSLLIPLSEILGVSVTELLKGEKTADNSTLTKREMDDIVKYAFSISGKKNKPELQIGKKYILAFITCFIIGASAVHIEWLSLTIFHSCSRTFKTGCVMLLVAAGAGLYGVFTPALNIRCKFPGINITDCSRRHAAAALRIWAPFTMATHFYFTYRLFYCLYKFIFDKMHWIDWRGDWAECIAMIISVILYYALFSILIKRKTKNNAL